MDIIPDQSRTGQAPGRAALVGIRHEAEAVVRAHKVEVVPTAATVTRPGEKVRAIIDPEQKASKRLTIAQTRRRGKETTIHHVRGRRQRPLQKRNKPCATTLHGLTWVTPVVPPSYLSDHRGPTQKGISGHIALILRWKTASIRLMGRR